MKPFKIAVLPFLIFSLFIIMGTAYASQQSPEVSQEISEHLSMAASYDEKAKEQNALIAEHGAMKREYERKHFSKVGPSKDVIGMNKHCDGIISAATNLKDEFSDFAHWHKMRAAELQGK